MKTLLTPILAGLTLSMTPDPDLRFKSKYNAQDWKQIQSYRQAYQQAQTLTDFVAVYQAGVKMNPRWSVPFQKEHESFLKQLEQNPKQNLTQPNYDWTDGRLPGFRLSHVAEGTQLSWLTHWADFVQLARKTPSQLDDDFAQLKLDLHGPYENGFPSWMVQTWDYGGCSQLGKGQHSRFWQAFQTQLQPQSPFFSDLWQERKYLWRNLIQSEDFCGSRSEALKELAQIKKRFQWSVEEKEALSQTEERLKQLKASAFNQLGE